MCEENECPQAKICARSLFEDEKNKISGNKNRLQVHAIESATMRFILPDWSFYIMRLEK